MATARNPQHGQLKLPADYKDLGWQLCSDNSEHVKKCYEAGHRRREYNNSLYQNRGTDTIYICDECKNYYHIDSSD